MKLNFQINPTYFIIHTLSSMEPGRFSSSRFKKDIISIQNAAWKLSYESYDLLVCRLRAENYIDKKVVDSGKSIYRRILETFSNLKTNWV